VRLSGWGEIGLDVVDQLIERIPPLLILLGQAIEWTLQAKVWQHQRRNQPVDLIIELQAIHQGLAVPQQLVSLAEFLAKQHLQRHLQGFPRETPTMAVLEFFGPVAAHESAQVVLSNREAQRPGRSASL
jgi:hypothetical protein